MPRSPRTVVCTCEDVTLADLETALAKGYRDVESVKRYSGFGTGICQGRSCLVAIARFLEARGLAADAVAPITPRPPIFPVALGRLAAAAPPTAASPGAPAPGAPAAPAPGTAPDPVPEDDR